MVKKKKIFNIIKESLNNFLYFFKRKYRQIKNVIRWIPIVWKQFDFDYNYALDAFKFQLEKTADFLESDKAHTVEAKNNASRIRMVLRLMEKVYNEEYACEYQEQIKELYGESRFEFVPSIKREGCFEMEEIYDIKYSNKQLKEIEIKKQELFKKSEEKQKRAHKLLWELIEHNIQNWWD